VAATRARDELYLVYPLVAAPRDNERTLMKVSRFVEELPDGDKAAYDRVQIEVEPLPLALIPPTSAATAVLPAHVVEAPRLDEDRPVRQRPDDEG